MTLALTSEAPPVLYALVPCAGTGERGHTHHFRLALPPGVADGARFRFVVAPPSVRATRVEVTVSVA